MNEDDPFGIESVDKTVFNPVSNSLKNPRRTAAPAAYPSSPPRARPMPPRPEPAGPLVPLPRTGVNPLAATAAPLLALAARLRTAAPTMPPDRLRDQVMAALHDFEERTRTLDLPREDIDAARYALCATVDDIVLNTPWGNRSIWATAGMVSSLHNEVTGGQGFYDLLDRLLRNPGAHRDVLELMYLCMALGFEGRYRLTPRGPADLMRERQRVYQAVIDRRDTAERELSAHWRGVAMPHRPSAGAVPAWAIGTATAVLLLAIYAGFSFSLNTSSDAVFASLAALPPQAPVPFDRPAPAPAAIAAPAAAPPVMPAAPAPTEQQSDRIRRFLAPEIAEGLVSVLNTPEGLTVRLHGRGIFKSGSASVAPSYHPVLDRIGQALEQEPNRVVVTGHTDDVPIRSIRFPSNWHLSKARAEAVRDLLAGRLSEPGRVGADGRADLDPIASNDTPEGRELNRRTDIVLRRLAADIP
jgi:type VI secretion system protein ImpK